MGIRWRRRCRTNSICTRIVLCTRSPCQPKGQCASVDYRGASSECKPLIYCSHNSHSLSNYSVDISLVSWPWDYVAGYEHLRFHCAFNSHSVYANVPQERCAPSWSSCTMYSDSLLLSNLLVIAEWISNTLTPSSLESLWAIASISIHSSWSSQPKDHFYPLQTLLFYW